jgi:histidine triad (HIT) family protein
MVFNESCIFCKIVSKKAPVSVIYEDKNAVAFLDIRPLNLGHALVITKNHYEDIFDIPDKDLATIHEVAKKISPAIRETTKADGISIIQQNGKAAGQDIFHIHIHVVPRFFGQKLKSFSELAEVDRPILDELAQKIRQNLR